MENHKNPEGEIKQMSPIKYFEASTTTNKWQGANKHNHEYGDEKETSWICPSGDESKEARPRGEEELGK